jgi:tetratricopeptide (TPR) repeat protein
MLHVTTRQALAAALHSQTVRLTSWARYRSEAIAAVIIVALFAIAFSLLVVPILKSLTSLQRFSAMWEQYGIANASDVAGIVAAVLAVAGVWASRRQQERARQAGLTTQEAEMVSIAIRYQLTPEQMTALADVLLRLRVNRRSGGRQLLAKAGLEMTRNGETLRQSIPAAERLQALGLRPGGESAYAEAMQAYQQLLAEHPDDATLHQEYGVLQECHGRNLIRAAAACYERAIELDPGWDKPHYQLIVARADRAESERVIELHKRRLAAAPEQIRGYRFLVSAYLRAGALDEAEKVIAAGRKLEPDDDMLAAAEAELLDASGRREEALMAWSRLKDSDPDDLSPYFKSAFTLEALGRYQEAAAEWRHIISWLEARDDAVHTTWPKEMLEQVEAKLAAADPDANGAGG